MNALYAIVFSACCVVSSVRGQDVATTESDIATYPPIYVNSEESNAFSIQTTNAETETTTASSTVSYSSTSMNEPITQNVPSVATSTQGHLTTPADDKSSASISSTGKDTSTMGNVSPTTREPKPSVIMVIPTTKRSTASSSSSTTKQPEKAPSMGSTSTTPPSDKSSASLTKISILSIVVAVLYCLLYS